jgi:hypothetical protein
MYTCPAGINAVRGDMGVRSLLACVQGPLGPPARTSPSRADPDPDRGPRCRRGHGREEENDHAFQLGRRALRDHVAGGSVVVTDVRMHPIDAEAGAMSSFSKKKIYS